MSPRITASYCRAVRRRRDFPHRLRSAVPAIARDLLFLAREKHPLPTIWHGCSNVCSVCILRFSISSRKYFAPGDLSALDIDYRRARRRLRGEHNAQICRTIQREVRYTNERRIMCICRKCARLVHGATRRITLPGNRNSLVRRNINCTAQTRAF